jgi:hypothetical protein
MALKRSAVRFRLAPPVFSKSWLKNYFKWAISSIALVLVLVLVLVLCIGGLIGLFIRLSGLGHLRRHDPNACH